jgi:cytochrome c553
MQRLAFAIGIAQLAVSLCTGAELSGAGEYALVIHAIPDREHGGQIFRYSCAPCHGASGEGYAGGAAASFPVTAGQHFRVLAMALVRFRHGQTSTHRMQYFSNAHRLAGAQDVADVAAYIAALQPPSPVGMGSGLSLKDGARVYLRYCESCHGATGVGDAARLVPRLAGQHYRYLLRQFDAPTVDDLLHAKRVQQLTARDRDAVADYLSRLLPPVPNGG